MATIRNFSMGLTAKGAVWYSYTTADGAKVASGNGGPAHAVDFASALQAAGIAAPEAASDAAFVAAAVSQGQRLSADLLAARARIAALESQLAQVTADLHDSHAAATIAAHSPPVAAAQALDASEVARNATATADRKWQAELAKRAAEIAKLTADLATERKARADVEAKCDAAVTLAGADRVAAWLAPQSEVANG